ncbi:MAG: ScpA family protein [Patescibacteria group bacterium]
MNNPDFTIKTEVFEGPLDLLLTLVEKRKLFINDISLVKVTDEYIVYINQLPDYSMGDRAQFIVIASTLLLVKAKSLLPTLQLTEDEKGDIEDLQDRLRQLEVMRRLGGIIKDTFGARFIFPRGDVRQEIRVFAPSKDATLSSLTEAIHRVLNALPKKIEQPKVYVRKVISLEEMIGRLTDRISSAVRMSFKDFHGGSKAEKVDVIVSFLAMLELVKQGVINAHQEGLFDEIHMESHDIGVPRY